MPGSALGRITLNAVWVKEAPRAKEALWYVFGIALILSSVVLITVGRSMIDKVKAPARTLAPLEEDILLTKGIKTIKEINEAGTTIFLVEQNAKKALSIATRAYVIETGNITKVGTGKELLNDEDVIKAYLGG